MSGRDKLASLGLRARFSRNVATTTANGRHDGNLWRRDDSGARSGEDELEMADGLGFNCITGLIYDDG